MGVGRLDRIPVGSPASVSVFRRILTHGPLGRLEVARATGLSPAAVTKAVRPLIAAGYVAESGRTRGDVAVGRPVNPLVVLRDRAHLVGVKVTAERCYGVLTDLGAVTLARAEAPNESAGSEDVVRAVDHVVRTLARASPDGSVAGVGVAVSGDVDRVSGTVRDSPLLGWADVALRQRLEPTLGLPVTVENDVRALTTAEHLFGAGRDAASFAVVTVGAGVGCGLFLNGRVLQGAHGVSGELGHLPLAPDELVCTCGRHGCVETVASTPAVVARVRAASGRPDLTVDDVIGLAHAGHEAAVEAFAAAGEVIGAALAVLVNLVGPELVIIAGEGVEEYALYGERIAATFAEHTFGAAGRCDVVLSRHSFDDWARGAAVCVIDEISAGLS